MTETATRPLYEIADEITRDWRPVGYAALPYVQAMRRLEKITDSYGMDDAEDIVLRFVGNAKTWRGPVAQRVKAELRALLPKRGRR